jgi:hypothetical protein
MGLYTLPNLKLSNGFDTICYNPWKSASHMWRSTLPGNEDVLICIFAPFLTQRVLKPWWPRTYQNSAVKRAFVRVVPGWLTTWEVWFGGAKSGQYCVVRGGSLQMVSEPLLSLRWGERAQAHGGLQRALVGTPRIGESHEGHQWRHWVPRGGDRGMPHCLGIRMCLYVYLHPFWYKTF